VNGQTWLARVREAFADEWHGRAPVADVEAELARARGREVARLRHDAGMLTALRLVKTRQERSFAVDQRDLDTLDAVIETLSARCPEETTEEVTP
jgi:hypothetical protein